MFTDVVDAVTNAAGEVYLLSSAGAVLQGAADPRVLEATASPRDEKLRGMALDAYDGVWKFGARTIEPPRGRPAYTIPPKLEILHLVPGAHPFVWAINGKSGTVVQLAPDGRKTTVHKLSGRSPHHRLVADGTAGIWALDARSSTLFHFGHDGVELARHSIGQHVSAPRDLGRDALGNLYVLDADPPGVVILSAQGKHVRSVRLEPQADPNFAKPSCMAVKGSGKVVVLDTMAGAGRWIY